MEDQDYWKYSGIERDVYLYARPQSRVKDFKLTAELINQYKDGDFDVNITLNQPQQGQCVEFKLLDAKGNALYTQDKEIKNNTDTLLSGKNYLRMLWHGQPKHLIFTHWLSTHSTSKENRWNHLHIHSDSAL